MQLHETGRLAMLNAETVQYAFLLIRSADGYARVVRCRLMRRIKPDYVCH